jgi:hypothetical protein
MARQIVDLEKLAEAQAVADDDLIQLLVTAVKPA